MPVIDYSYVKKPPKNSVSRGLEASRLINTSMFRMTHPNFTGTKTLLLGKLPAYVLLHLAIHLYCLSYSLIDYSEEL